MPIPFACPHCGLETTFADQYAGQSEPCSRCGKPITIPGTPFSPPPKPTSKSPILIIVLAVGLALVCAGILSDGPAIVAQREATRRVRCQNNLKQIGLALLSYEQANGAFPPAVFTDDLGKPTISWRVAILPYLEHSDLYRAFDAKQSWDSPKNRVPGNIHLEVFRCPSDPGATAGTAETNYVRIVGKDTASGTASEAVKISDITDGPANTIMVAEVCGLNIHWAEPRDVTVEEFTELFAKRRASFHYGGFQAVMADGSVHFFSYGIAPKTLRALLLRNDGQPVGDY
jgi:hypothetical protein